MLEKANQTIIASGLTKQEFATKIDVSPYVLTDVLSGRRLCRRGASHRAAVALGLKKTIESVSKASQTWQIAQNGSHSELPAALVAATENTEPTYYERQLIEIFNWYPATTNAQLFQLPLYSGKLKISRRKLAHRHRWCQTTVRNAINRYLGKDKTPRYTLSWLIVAAASLASGAEICHGMTKQIRDQRMLLTDHLKESKSNEST